LVDVGPPSPSITGHVLLPAATPHRPLRLVRDINLLLAATIASVRMNRPASVFEPPASLAACARIEVVLLAHFSSSAVVLDHEKAMLTERLNRLLEIIRRIEGTAPYDGWSWEGEDLS
jgi:hypothetical protein